MPCSTVSLAFWSCHTQAGSAIERNALSTVSIATQGARSSAYATVILPLTPMQHVPASTVACAGVP